MAEAVLPNMLLHLFDFVLDQGILCMPIHIYIYITIVTMCIYMCVCLYMYVFVYFLSRIR